jgi:hypothetical protein
VVSLPSDRLDNAQSLASTAARAAHALLDLTDAVFKRDLNYDPLYLSVDNPHELNDAIDAVRRLRGAIANNSRQWNQLTNAPGLSEDIESALGFLFRWQWCARIQPSPAQLDEDPYLAPPDRLPDRLKRIAVRLLRDATALSQAKMDGRLAQLARKPFDELTEDERLFLATQLVHVDVDSRVMWIGPSRDACWNRIPMTPKGARLVECLLEAAPTDFWTTDQLKSWSSLGKKSLRPPKEFGLACAADGTSPILSSGTSSDRHYSLNVEWLHRRLALSLRTGEESRA